MLNIIAQILLGIIYGLYLAFLAPTFQRQKAHDWLKQQATTPTMQTKQMQPQIFSPVIESTPKLVSNACVEDIWLAQSTHAAIKNQKNQTAIAIKKQLCTTTITQIDSKQSTSFHTAQRPSSL